MFCKFCGKETDDGVDVCGECRKAAQEHYNSESEISIRFRQNGGRKIAAAEAAGLMIAVLGVLAIVYCGLSIRDDMIPYGLAGIRADYRSPFSPYEKRQILKLVIAVLVFIAGCVIWAVGRNCPEYAVHAFLLIVIIVAVISLAVTAKIAKIRGEESDGWYWGDACLQNQACADSGIEDGGITWIRR